MKHQEQCPAPSNPVEVLVLLLLSCFNRKARRGEDTEN